MKRRRFIKRGIIGTTGLAFLQGMYTWQVEPFWLDFVNVKMPIRHLPKKLHGKTLMQISDIHIDKKATNDFVIKSFKKAQKLKPDFVVYTGDFVNEGTAQQLINLKNVMQHRVRGKKGTVAILGNHDYGHNWNQKTIANQISNVLRRKDIKVLRNQQISLHGLNIIGFDDLWGPSFNPNAVMRKYYEKKANIILCHNPDVCDLNVWNNYKGWILSGHTHGGQCKPPFLKPPLLPVKNKKYTAGQFNLGDGRTLYINRALGHTLQVRFNVKPEITIFELQCA